MIEGNAVRSTLLAVLLATAILASGCAARKQYLRQIEAGQQKVVREYNSCVVDYVVQHDAPRLTGTEMTDAATTGCTAKLAELRQLMILQSYEESEIRPVLANVITDAKRLGLDALARHAGTTSRPAVEIQVN